MSFENFAFGVVDESQFNRLFRDLVSAEIIPQTELLVKHGNRNPDMIFRKEFVFDFVEHE
jgi:hypothetical protein